MHKTASFLCVGVNSNNLDIQNFRGVRGEIMLLYLKVSSLWLGCSVILESKWFKLRLELFSIVFNLCVIVLS